VRRRERDGDADDGDESDDRDAGDAEFSEHAHEPGQLHGEHVERDGDDHDQHMGGEHDGDHDYREHGADGVDGVHDQVLVRRVLGRQGTRDQGLRDLGTLGTWNRVAKGAIAHRAQERGGEGAAAATKTTQFDGSGSEVRLRSGVAPSLGARPGQSRAKPAVCARLRGYWEGHVAAVDVESATKANWIKALHRLDREQLERLGIILDTPLDTVGGSTVAMALAQAMLVVRTRAGRPAKLEANAVQQEFEKRRGQRNIVLKARQMGLTTWVAGRFFLKTITQPGTLTLEVAHTQEAAEEIFRIVHRFLDWLPDRVRKGTLRTARSNVRQIVFPRIDAQYRVVSAADRNAGRGLTVQNLHCSEIARWPGDAAEILAGLRAALAPGAEMVLESTPQGVGGCFHEEWLKADETGMVRHFFPWWMEERTGQRQ
jgi:hypothetical protein